MVTKIWVNIGSGNGLLPDGTKPLPEPMLTYHQSGQVAFIFKCNFTRATSAINRWNWLENYPVCEIVFEEVIDHRSWVKMIHHRPTVYTYRPVMLSYSETHEITIDRWTTRLDSLPSPTQFLPRSGPRSMGKNAHIYVKFHSNLPGANELNAPHVS